MSLFVGNISKYVKTFELEDEFKQFGRCEIKRNVSNVSQYILVLNMFLYSVGRVPMHSSSLRTRRMPKRP